MGTSLRVQRLVLGLLLAAGLAGLATGQASDPAVPPGWAAVLNRFVDDYGRVDFEGIAQAPADLDSAVAYIASTSPEANPSLFANREARLAYYINAYNALAMFNVVDSGIPRSLAGLQKFSFFWVKKFSIGGRSMSLYALENEVIRPLQEERVHFALNCMVVSCPRLPRAPFTTGNLDRELAAAAQLFFSEKRNLTIWSDAREIKVSEILKFYREDFLRTSPDLIAYINRHRETKIPQGYKVDFIDYDWTINDSRRVPPPD
ncbi:MAG TPA: DUF547 domain-containing protein [Casimicrobiaceae bacterium]|jgi:hypothetical protein|nr:DUF547 domain-containing protein [Casimicrobiaceae bacterium]